MIYTDVKETVDEGNKIIANFMGLKLITEEEVTEDMDINEFVLYPRYHSSWNWLMDVLEKFDDMGYPFLISRGTVTIYKVRNKEWLAHEHGYNQDEELEESTITTAWRAVVGAIKELNKNENKRRRKKT